MIYVNLSILMFVFCCLLIDNSDVQYIRLGVTMYGQLCDCFVSVYCMVSYVIVL